MPCTHRREKLNELRAAARPWGDAGRIRAAARRLLRTAVAALIFAPMLAGCELLRGDGAGLGIYELANRFVFLPAPPPLLCSSMLAGSNISGVQDFCSTSHPVAYDPVTGNLYLGCDLKTAQVALFQFGLNFKQCALHGPELRKGTTGHTQYLNWLATQGIATPGVPDPVLTDTPTVVVD